jgi:S1-C subfamily serine protease
LKPGDRIVQLAGCDIDSGKELVRAVMTAQSPAHAVVVRDDPEKPLEITLELEGKPLRLGVCWRLDDAEPGVMILTHIVPGSPADQAGLMTEDRVYQVDGHDLTSESQFIDLVATTLGSLELLIERSGRIRRVVVHVDPSERKRAA